MMISALRGVVLVCALALAASSARADAFDEVSVRRIDAQRVLVTWSGKAPVDVYVADTPSFEPQGAYLISDDDTDGRHEYRTAQGKRAYFLLSTRDGRFRRTAERVIPLEAGSNFRDVGGYETDAGKHVRWGLIYRTGAMSQLTDRDYALLNTLGIRVFCDLRSAEERVLAPTRAEAVSGSRYFAVDYSANSIFQPLLSGDATTSVNDASAGKAGGQRNSYREWPQSLAPQYREIFDALIAGEAPLAFNCSAGQDRTGVATALVLAALGVPRETILEDYHLSTLYRRPQFERGTADYQTLAATNVVARFYVESSKRGADALKPRPLYDDAGRARLLATFDEIEQRWGTIERYLEQVLDVDTNDIARLRALYLE